MDKQVNFEDKSSSTEEDLENYFRRPIIYFCCGIPLLVPSIFLILLATFEDLHPIFLVFGCLNLFISTMAIFMGFLMACRDRQRTAQARDIEAIKESAQWAKPQQKSQVSLATTSQFSLSSIESTQSAAKTSNKKINQPLNKSANSSYSSTKNNFVTILSNTDKTKLVKLRKKSALRKKKGVKFPNTRLPSLQEEDSFVKSCSGHHQNVNDNNTNITIQVNAPSEGAPPKSGRGLRRPQGAITGNTMGEFQDYLSKIGLGGGKLPDSENDGAMPLTSKSVDERHLSRDKLEVQQRQTPLTSRDLTVPLSPGRDYPQLVTVSHERTGVRIPDVR